MLLYWFHIIFAYSVFCYRLPIICCSNRFLLTQSEGLSPEDYDWIRANVVAVPVPVSGRWYVPEDEEGIEDA